MRLLPFLFLFFGHAAGVSLQRAHAQSTPKSNSAPKAVLVVHGGAGTILKKNMTPEKEALYRAGLTKALQAGYAIINRGGTSLDAVEAAVRVLEDDSLFNAGKGAVFTNAGKNEMDAAIMNGKTLAAGSVASVTTIRNPISAARVVMEKSEHVMLIGAGAEGFAAQHGLQIVDPSYFHTWSRWQGLLRVRAEDSLKTELDHGSKKSSGVRQPANRDSKYGTVGAVAIDKAGNLAAATSTGGMTNKKWGRVGDAPIIGAGTYASNATCAVSGTGWGEYYIRLVLAKTIADLMEYKGYGVKQAGDELVMKRLQALGGDGGAIILDRKGNFSMPFCTDGMYRGWVDAAGKVTVDIYK